MKTLIIYAHPNPASFTAALRDSIVDAHRELGNEVRVRDLYAMRFDPVFSGPELGAVFGGQGSFGDAREEQEHLLWADHIVLVYPIWWLDRPAILKGYIDRVFVNGVAFLYEESGPKPLLQGRTAAVYQVAGTPEEVYQATGLSDAIERTIRKGLFEFCGINEVQMHQHFAIAMGPDERRHAILHDTRRAILDSARQEVLVP